MLDIAEKMRRIADAARRADGTDTPLGEQCREAADAIERLTRGRDEARAENERLREALAPFAKAGELFPERHPDGFDMVIYAPAAGPAYNIVAEDLRRARAAMIPSGKPEKTP